MKTTLMAFLHIHNVLSLLYTVAILSNHSLLANRRTACLVQYKRYIRSAFTGSVKVDSLLCAEPDGRLALDRSRKARNKCSSINIQYGRCMALVHHLIGT